MAAALYVSDNNMLVPTTHGAYIARYLAEPYNLPNNRCELKVSRLYEEWGLARTIGMEIYCRWIGVFLYGLSFFFQVRRFKHFKQKFELLS